MIETVTLRNYRGHTDTTVSCRRLTVLVGENASGKTSVLEALRRVWGGLDATLPARLLRDGTSELEILLDTESREGKTEIRASYRRASGGGDELERTRGTVELDDGSIGYRPVCLWLSLRSGALAASSAARTRRPVLQADGHGLASVLAHLKLTETERLERIVERLQEVVPIVRGVRFARVEVEESGSRLIRVEDRLVPIDDTVTTVHDALLFDFIDATGVPADLVSEGTLITLGMFTALETLDRETRDVAASGTMYVRQHPIDVVLIDDVDRALHPRAQRSLMAAIRATLEATPGLQVIATAHSPYLIDALELDEVVVLGRNEHGVIAAKSLGEFPDERLKRMLSTGELWISEGDTWVRR